MVDDDPDDLFLTKTSFQKADYPFKFTGLKSAEALFKHVEQNGLKDVDIILLDLNMPNLGGLDALKTLRQNPGIQDLKVFIFSTSKNNNDRDQCIEAGADGYLYKPSRADEVKRFVNTVSLASNFWV